MMLYYAYVVFLLLWAVSVWSMSAWEKKSWTHSWLSKLMVALKLALFHNSSEMFLNWTTLGRERKEIEKWIWNIFMGLDFVNYSCLILLLFMVLNSKIFVLLSGNLQRIFRCLSEVIIVYGQEIVSCQLIPFFFNQLSDVPWPLTIRALSGILAALHILKLSLALITDQFLMTKLLSFIQCLTHSANLFMNPSLHLLHGRTFREMLANIWIRTTIEICERIGREMIILHFVRLIFSFFVNAERFHARHVQDVAGSAATNISPLRYGFATSSSVLSDDDFYTDVSLEGASTVYGTPQRLSSILNTQLDCKLSCPELHTYKDLSEETSEEFEICFGPGALLTMYNPICRVLGNIYMESHMSRYPFSKSLIDQRVEENSGETSEASSTEELEDDLSIAELDSKPVDGSHNLEFGLFRVYLLKSLHDKSELHLKLFPEGFWSMWILAVL